MRNMGNMQIRGKFLLLLFGSRFLKNKNFFAFFKVGEIMGSKYGHLMIPGAFPDKVVTDIDFTCEAVVRCDVSVLKTLL